ncbi:MAG: hypothetical protein GX960_00915 [Actinomycetales bacterium]|nr:hypothetical protein [Actinomycetales bacterium]
MSTPWSETAIDAEERAHLEQMAQRARAWFAVAREQGEDGAQALQSVAIELQLSLEDCAAAVGRTDLLDRLGTSWELGRSEPPALGS